MQQERSAVVQWINAFDNDTQHFQPTFNVRTSHPLGAHTDFFHMTIGTNEDAREVTLTAAEFDVLTHLVTHPVSNKDLALFLEKSSHTIHTFVNTIFKKLGIEDANKIKMIHTLLESGALTYTASSDPADF